MECQVGLLPLQQTELPTYLLLLQLGSPAKQIVHFAKDRRKEGSDQIRMRLSRDLKMNKDDERGRV